MKKRVGDDSGGADYVKDLGRVKDATGAALAVAAYRAQQILAGAMSDFDLTNEQIAELAVEGRDVYAACQAMGVNPTEFVKLDLSGIEPGGDDVLSIDKSMKLGSGAPKEKRLAAGNSRSGYKTSAGSGQETTYGSVMIRLKEYRADGREFLDAAKGYAKNDPKLMGMLREGQRRGSWHLDVRDTEKVVSRVRDLYGAAQSGGNDDNVRGNEDVPLSAAVGNAWCVLRLYQQEGIKGKGGLMKNVWEAFDSDTTAQKFVYKRTGDKRSEQFVKSSRVEALRARIKKHIVPIVMGKYGIGDENKDDDRETLTIGDVFELGGYRQLEKRVILDNFDAYPGLGQLFYLVGGSVRTCEAKNKDQVIEQMDDILKQEKGIEKDRPAREPAAGSDTLVDVDEVLGMAEIEQRFGSAGLTVDVVQDLADDPKYEDLLVPTDIPDDFDGKGYTVGALLKVIEMRKGAKSD